MAHPQQMRFIGSVKNAYPAYFIKRRVLEVGSYNVNGTIRTLFTDCDYTGLDLAPGKDVDIVCAGHQYAPADGKLFDVVISTECFEHDQHWAATFRNMVRLAAKNGLIMFTCASYKRSEHGTQRIAPESSLSSSFSDYYKNLNMFNFAPVSDFSAVFSLYSFIGHENDLYFMGIKR